MRRVFIAMMLVLSTIVMAQGPGMAPGKGPGNGQKFDPQKFEQQLEAYVLQKMKLTQAEKTKFLPIYREMRKKEVAAIQSEGNLDKMGKPKTDKEFAERMKKHDAAQVEQKKVQQTYHLKMLKVVSAQKVMEMIRAEEDYHREAFRKFQGGQPGGKPGPGGKGPGGKGHHGPRPSK